MIKFVFDVIKTTVLLTPLFQLCLLAQELPSKEFYNKTCLACHGASGAGFHAKETSVNLTLLSDAYLQEQFEAIVSGKRKSVGAKKMAEALKSYSKQDLHQAMLYASQLPLANSRYTLKRADVKKGHLHIEWASPAEVVGKGQGRGNSGVFIAGYPEIQVLDSYNNQTYPDGQAGALYKRSVPIVNACRKPGEWQCYDIYFTRSKKNKKTGKVIPGTLTVYHNNVLIQDNFKHNTSEGGGTLGMQDHKNPVRFRNIWFVEGQIKP